jgi:hypothetical protein
MSHDKDQRVYGFSKSGHSRVSQAVRYVEKHRGGVGNEGMPSVRSSSPVTVKVTELPGTDPELDPLYHVGVFTHWSNSEEDWEDSEEKCYIFQESFDDLVVGTRYPGQVVDNHDHGAVVVTVSVGGSASEWFPAKITGSSGSPLGSSWTEQEMTSAGVWANKTGGLSGTTNAYRMPSDESAPVVENNQVVMMRASPSVDTKYEFSPWGSLTSPVDQFVTNVSVECNSGSLVVTQTKKTLKARDLSASS